MEGKDGFLVRTFCAAYNHESYITDALKGFVKQETTFPVVYAIVDDASTDRTAEVIREFVKENFALQDTSVAYEKDTDYGHVTFAQHKTNKNCFFAVIYLKENHYSQKKPKTPYLTEWEDTKYIALCEGDDYWTDPLKLQKQVNYMENHPDCCMCSHSADWEIEGELYKGGCQYKDSRNLTTDDVIRNNGLYLATNSLVYRAWLNNERPDWRTKAAVGDFPLQVLGTLKGELHFLSDTMSVYRFMRSGSWTTQQNVSKERRLSHAKNKTLWMGLLDIDTGYQYTKAIYSCLFMEYRVLYEAGEIGFVAYLCAAVKAGENHYIKRTIKDFLIKNGRLPYEVWKKLARKGDGQTNK